MMDWDKPEVINMTCGTPLYVSPNLIHAVMWGPGTTSRDVPTWDWYKNDVWACGVVMFVMLHGGQPFEPETEEKSDNYLVDIYKLALESITVSSDLSPACMDVLEVVMAPEEDARPTADELLAMEWFDLARPPVV